MVTKPPIEEEGLGIYFKSIQRSNGLGREREKELSARVMAGDESAVNELAEGNLQFVVFVAREYIRRNRKLVLSDLISSGNVGLLIAARRYDWKRGFKFISYAVWWVRQQILLDMKETRIRHLPMNRAQDLIGLDHVTAVLQQELGREPLVSELADRLAVSEDRVDIMLQDRLDTLYLEDFIVDEPSKEVDSILEDKNAVLAEQAVQEQEQLEALQEAIAALPLSEAQVLRSYYGIDGSSGATLGKIGIVRGRTRERIRQIRSKGLKHMKHNLQNWEKRDAECASS